jgi:tripartite-type tricarboxylate transporter receptor subunit TctC
MYALPALCLLLAGAIAALAPAESLAQAISRTPLRMIVAVPAGGTSDVVARLLARRLEVQLGQPVVVDNRVGATGRIAVAALKSAAPDGGTVLFAPAVIPVLGPLVFRNKTYPARDLGAFIQWKRGHPKQAYVGNPGAGSLPHLLGVRLAQAAGGLLASDRGSKQVLGRIGGRSMRAPGLRCIRLRWRACADALSR